MPPFVPYPPDSLRQSEAQSESSEPSSAETLRLHFSMVWVAALKLGYTRRDLADMPYGEVIFDLAAMSGGRQPEQETNSGAAVSMATQEDIRSMLG